MPLVLRLTSFIALGWVLAQAQAQTPASYSLQTLAGSDYVGDGGPALAALLVQVEGLATDASGNIYLSDAAGNRVRKIAPGGVISTLAGNGHPGFSGDGGPAASAQLRTPYGVAADGNGNVYIADLGNARIRRVSTDGVITTFAGGGALAPAQAEGGPANAMALSSPRNVAIDGQGIVYFSDFRAHRVYRVSSSGTLNLVSGTGEPGFSGDGGPAVQAHISAPAGLAVDPSGVLYFADSGNARVRKVYQGTITTLGDSGVSGAQPSLALNLPTGLALHPDGTLFIADPGGNQILRVSPSLAATPIAQPARDLATDAQGNLYICSGPLVYIIPGVGGPILISGGNAAVYSGDGGPLDRVRFTNPSGIARDSAGNLYIADTGAHRVRKITQQGDSFTIAGNGMKGSSDAQLDTPTGLAVDRSGNLYIADSGNRRIRKVDVAGVITTVAEALDNPTWLALDAAGTLYFSETGAHAVRSLQPGGQMLTIAGNGVRGYSGDGGAATLASLDSPQGIAVDSLGGVFIADAGNQRIRYVAPPSTSGAALITSVPDLRSTNWRNPRGLAVDPQGSVFAADAADARVFRMDPSGRVSAIAGTGVAAFTGESGAALSQSLDTPMGVTLDAAGNVYLVDSGNGRIRILKPVPDTTPPVLPPPAQTAPSITVVSAASLEPGPAAPGELLSIFGDGLGPATGVAAAQPGAELGGTQVLFNGHAATLFYAGQNQLNLEVPQSLGDARPCDVEVMVNGVMVARAAVQVADSVPAIFTVAGGTGQAAALNEDGSLNSAAHPAARGSIVVLFVTGVPVPVPPLTVRIGAYTAEILYAGGRQINARIPGGFAPPGILPVTLQIGTAVSQAGVTIAVQ